MPLITEKGVLFTIIWNAFAVLSFFTCTSQLTAIVDEAAIEYTVIMALYPVIGLIADIWIGRYKILTIAKYMMSIAMTHTALKLLLLPDLCYLTHVVLPFLGFTGACYFSCLV